MSVEKTTTVETAGDKPDCAPLGLLAVARSAAVLLDGRLYIELNAQEKRLYKTLHDAKLLGVNEHGTLSRRRS